METLLQLSPVVLAAIPVVVGLSEVAKQIGLPSRFAPVISILLGVGVSFLLNPAWPEFVTQGLLIGLSASGLYSGVKKQFDFQG